MVPAARITVAQLTEPLLLLHVHATRLCSAWVNTASQGTPTHQLLQWPTLTATSGPTISLSLPARCRLLSHTWRLKSASDLLLYVMLCLTSHSRHAVVG